MLQAKASARAFIINRAPNLHQNFDKLFLSCLISSSGAKTALIHRTFLSELKSVHSVAVAAEAARLCRMQLQAADSHIPVLSVSNHLSASPSHAVLPSPPADSSMLSFAILHAVFSPVVPACASIYLFAKKLASIGITSDAYIPYISRSQLAQAGVPSHLMGDLLTLVQPLHVPISNL